MYFPLEKTKALISCAQLICAFVFAYAIICFSLDAAHTYTGFGNRLKPGNDSLCESFQNEPAFPTKSDTNQPAQSQEQARSLKCRI